MSSLINAPAYDPTRDNVIRYSIFGFIGLIFLAAILGVTGLFTGHGLFFINLPAEHKVSNFFTALEKKDYATAYGIYWNDPSWQQHPQTHTDYPLKRFVEDWTTDSPVKGPIVSHHVDLSKKDGSGMFGGSIIVAVTVNGGQRVFVNVIRTDGTLSCCSVTHEIEY
jgi:hypothetical protein